MTKIAQFADVRASIVDKFRRDLIGPSPRQEDADLAAERLKENPSRWYLAGFLAPADDPLTQDGGKVEEEQAAIQDDAETEIAEPADDGAGGAAGDAELPDAPVANAVSCRLRSVSRSYCHRISEKSRRASPGEITALSPLCRRRF
jgi:hypothetical protein